MNRLITLLLVFFVIASCNNPSTSEDHSSAAEKTASLRTTLQKPESIILNLADRTDGDSTVSFRVQGLYDKDTVGFTLELRKNIPAGINNDGSVNEQDGFKKGSITFKRSGVESDRFVAGLAKLWQVGGADKMKTAPIQPMAFFSNKKPINLDKPSTSSFKLFFNDTSADPGEIFFTVDTYKRTIEFQERDAKHRSAIVHALTAESEN